ncbi:MAG: hypothetical protein C0501_28475 [Isosphaera sp.]|nr:hypothetical protein [Isosphaera sp.]
MSPTIPDLWPTDFGTSPQPSPASVLRQQAYLLGQRTQNVVVGEVESKPKKDRFVHTFYLSAPLLDFRRAVLHAEHGVEFYPAELAVYDEGGSHLANTSVPDADRFMSELRGHLASDRVVRLVRSLVDQCRDPEENLRVPSGA